jgi:flagellar motility protein MotE (MotC chaperone)
MVLLHVNLMAQTTDCTKIFEERKGELQREVEMIDEARQSFEALRAATNALFAKKEEALAKEQEKVDKTLEEIAEKETAIEAKLQETKELSALISGEKENKLQETYNKMKDSAAAAILEALSREEAAAILFSLPPKKVSQIMAKMEPVVASEITTLLSQGPPFNPVKE